MSSAFRVQKSKQVLKALLIVLHMQSQAPPNETLTNVLKVFESLHVRWKKIGHYNMKCLWLPPPSTYSKTTNVIGFPQGKLFHGLELSLASVSSMPVRSKYAVKFEIQVMSCPYFCFFYIRRYNKS